MVKVKMLITKYKDFIFYIFFGILSTLLNIIAYWFFVHLFQQTVMKSTIIAWVLTILFVYITNCKWVFHSEANNVMAVLKEIVTFFMCRLITGVVDWGCMFVFVTILKLDDVLIKTLANVLVIIFNYVASKLIVFKHKS